MELVGLKKGQEGGRGKILDSERKEVRSKSVEEAQHQAPTLLRCASWLSALRFSMLAFRPLEMVTAGPGATVQVARQEVM